MDTLDYSGTGLNTGSKVVFAAYGDPVRTLAVELPEEFKGISAFADCRMIMPGVAAFQTKPYVDEQTTLAEMRQINEILKGKTGQSFGVPLMIWSDDAHFTALSIKNFLWVAFTRANPSHDIYGIDEFYAHKHWGCIGPIILDARIKPHHAPAVVLDPEMVKKTDRFFATGGCLANII
jgi:4-hydroxy-3-polyprenylbenzoate decarboxylase